MHRGIAIAAVYIFLVLASTESTRTQSPLPTRTILVLFDEHTDLPGLSVVNKSISQTLDADPTFKTDIYVESMNLSRFQRDGYEEFLKEYYREKYKDKKIDVVIAVLGPPLRFALGHRHEIAPGASIVFCGVDPHEIAGKDLGENVTGILVKRDFTGTLEAALRMQPDTQGVVFIGGTSDFDKQLIETASQQLKSFEDRVSITYLVDRPLDSILKTVSQLPPHTIVLYSTFFRDGAGEAFVPHEVATLVSNAASVPVYGFVDQYLGRGIVGGHLYSFELHGTKAAESALRILHGESAKSIPIIEGNANVDMFDARQLKRWNINERTLPQASIIQFKQPSLWEEYQWYIVGVTLLLAIQSALIGLLLYLRYRRREAEAENTRLHGRLKEIVSNVPGIVWESRTDPAINTRKTTFISDYVQKMLGYTPKEWLDQQPGFGAKIISQDDRERVQAESDAVIETGREAVCEYRWFGKDGQMRWVENHVAPIFDGENGVVGLRGVALDVTERKAAEKALLESESRLRMAQQAARVGTWEWDIETGASVWSEMIWELLGLEPNEEDTTVETFVEFIHPEDRERVWRKVNSVIADGDEYYDEFRVIRRDGNILWLASKGALIRSGDGKPERMLGVNIDITELKHVQHEAQEISGRLISAHEDERARLARELHDDACQNLALLSIELELFGKDLPTDEESIRARINVLSERVSELSGDLRDLAHQLHPARLTHLGLAAAVRGFCNELESAHGLKVEFVEANVPETLSKATSLNIYRIIQESLQNVVKHSGASEASVILSANGNAIQLTISDNGCGFDPKISPPHGSLGLISIRERIRLLHGSITIDSRPDSGTRVEATIPV